MADIIKIVIKGTSGYCCSDEAYNDKVTITSESISYEYIHFMESEINPKRKWSYKTNSPIFKMKFDHIENIMPEIIERRIDEFCTDIGGIEFNITYADRAKFKEVYWVPGDYFNELFGMIKNLVPDCEYTPAVLLSSTDYGEDEENE